MARYCESCGKEMGDAAAFCSACGKPAVTPPAGGAGAGTGSGTDGGPDGGSDGGSGPDGGSGSGTDSGTAGGRSSSGDEPTTGLQPNVAGALAYLWITAIVFLLLEPYNRDRFVRFHSFQALFLGLAAVAGHVVLSIIPILGWMLMPVWSLLIVALAVVAALKAHQNQTWQMPVIGRFAQEQV